MQLELGRSHVISQRYPGPLTSEVTQVYNRLHHPPLLLPLASLSSNQTLLATFCSHLPTPNPISAWKQIPNVVSELNPPFFNPSLPF